MALDGYLDCEAIGFESRANQVASPSPMVISTIEFSCFNFFQPSILSHSNQLPERS
jgi:hypothetical protein